MLPFGCRAGQVAVPLQRERLEVKASSEGGFRKVRLRHGKAGCVEAARTTAAAP